MDKPIPKRLKKEPLLEAIWEIRFQSDAPGIRDILPGLLFQRYSGECPEVLRLPPADLPPFVLEEDEGLRYVPTFKLQGPQFSILIGARVVALSSQRPYAGWPVFSDKIKKLAAFLQETNLLHRPERFSLKYIDLLPESTIGKCSLDVFNLSLQVGGKDIAQLPSQLRTEIREDGWLHILQIASPAHTRIGQEEAVRGVLIDIDSITLADAESFWTDMENKLEEGHDRSKAIFFSLLKEETLLALQPEY